MNDTTKPRPAISRTYTAFTTGCSGCGENWGSSVHEVTILRDGVTSLASSVALIDGVKAPLRRALDILAGATELGVVSEVPMPEPVTPAAAAIGNAVAQALHQELGRLGYGRGYQVASDVLNRTVTSLAALTDAERDLVRDYAYGQLGLTIGGWAA